MNERPELFLLSWDVLDASHDDEIEATYADMEKINIAHLPYGLVDIGIAANLAASLTGNPDRSTIIVPEPGFPVNKHFSSATTVEIRFRYRDDVWYETIARNELTGNWITLKEHESKYDSKTGSYHAKVCKCPDCCRPWHLSTDGTFASDKYKKLLVVLLATKDITKTRTKDKLLAMGIGKNKNNNHHPIYTTTISLPLQFVTTHGDNHAPVNHTGVRLRPHLRRGHVTHQRHGPKNQYVKLIWIQPCFINKDEHYVPKRINYNVSMKCERIDSHDTTRKSDEQDSKQDSAEAQTAD